MFKIYLNNFGYYGKEEKSFNNAEDLARACTELGFEASIIRVTDKAIVGTYNPISQTLNMRQ